MCAERREAKARHVLGFVAGAHAVTEPVKLTAALRKLNARAAVRCSAWLGVTLLGETVQATTGQKREFSLHMKLREDQNRRLVEAGETTETEKLGLAETVERSECQSAVRGEDMELRLTKACVSG